MEMILIIMTILLSVVLINMYHLDSEVNFLGKENLKKVKSDGIQKKLNGVSN